MCGRCYISHIGEVLLSISSAYHIHLLCKMHFESCAISHDYQSKRYENKPSHPSVENATYALCKYAGSLSGFVTICHSPFIYYYWLGWGSIELEVCSTLIHMTSTVNQLYKLIHSATRSPIGVLEVTEFSTSQLHQVLNRSALHSGEWREILTKQ